MQLPSQHTTAQQRSLHSSKKDFSFASAPRIAIPSLTSSNLRITRNLMGPNQGYMLNGLHGGQSNLLRNSWIFCNCVLDYCQYVILLLYLCLSIHHQWRRF
ncbi:MAG: hypothetical protein EZS28_017558 [Streblomastix strix]|uniref:Uncharacterized protein n=1 Tax=Streblomastix strix TaxID=222440 RepID=A0A5J4VX56_9EUKA|nr:MAG: hypothetical protein EZS28_017558 [Streblomastix strix]